MKYVSCLFLCFLVAACGNGDAEADAVAYAAVNTPIENIDVAAEKEAIKATILSESAAFESKDIYQILEHYIDEDRITIIRNVPINDVEILKFRGDRNRLGKMFTARLTNLDNAVFQMTKRTDWHINLSPRADMAWVNFFQTMQSGDEVIRSEEVRVLEKVDGKWKLAHVGGFFYR
ncbi:MAG: hypothetical protein AAF828_05550 [Bacteroidota bacterium]